MLCLHKWRLLLLSFATCEWLSWADLLCSCWEFCPLDEGNDSFFGYLGGLKPFLMEFCLPPKEWTLKSHPDFCPLIFGVVFEAAVAQEAKAVGRTLGRGCGQVSNWFGCWRRLYVHPRSLTWHSHSPWKMMVGRLLSFSEGNFSGVMLNFRWVYDRENGVINYREQSGSQFLADIPKRLRIWNPRILHFGIWNPKSINRLNRPVELGSLHGLRISHQSSALQNCKPKSWWTLVVFKRFLRDPTPTKGSPTPTKGSPTPTPSTQIDFHTGFRSRKYKVGWYNSRGKDIYEQLKKGPWLVGLYRGWTTTQLYRDYFINHYKDPY